MRDKAEAQAVTTIGDFRAGAGLALAGAAILGFGYARTGSEPAAVPAALAVALIVFGLYLLALRTGFLAGRVRKSRSGIGFFETALEPVLVSDLDGWLIARNPAAAGVGLFDAQMPASEVRYRLTREARANGLATEETPEGRVSVARIGTGTLLWRIERAAAPAAEPEPAVSLGAASVAWIRVDGEGRMLDSNPAGAALAPERPDLERLLVELAERPEGAHLVNRGGQPVRVVALPAAGKARDLLLLPLDGAEISGLVPDRFPG